MLDLFNNNQFGVVSLTDAINKPIFAPGRLGQMGLFNERPVSTTTIVLEQKAGNLILVAPSPRGGPGVTVDKKKADARAIVVPHFEINDAIYADEVQGVRQWGTEDQLMTVMGMVADRIAIHKPSHEVTLEYQRMGAVKGVITYADNSTTDLFAFFGITQDAEIAFDLAGASINGILRKKVQAVIREMSVNLDGMPFSGIRALCGDNFFDDLLANAEVRATFLNQPGASELRTAYVTGGGQTYGQFEFGGVIWENYRGYVGGVSFIDPDKCHLYPVGVPNLFRTYFAPADYMETVNTMGKRLYLKQYRMDNDKGVNLDSQMNALSLCTRPKVLLKGRRSA